ncbi:hypothetical protein [Roseateles sp. LYH14W]|uniref:DUF2946 domain-containing protein n=1 Tax=Pelomonas parva TaxID=3299032 RepID=A0ABW7F7S6_9BURK
MNLRRWSRNWLLWLALLLPIAQAMAGVHALSHAGHDQDDAIVHLVDCDLCLTAAHLAGGAAAAEPAPLPAGAAVDARVTLRPTPALQRDAAWRPPARAPPASA